MTKPRGCLTPISFLKLFLAASLIVLALTSVGFAQEMSRSDVETLLSGGVAQKRIEDLIKERGIDFEFTDELRAGFSKIGAGPGVIRSLEYASIRSRLKRLEAAKAKPDPSAKEQRKTSEPTKEQATAGEMRTPTTKADPQVAREQKPTSAGKREIPQEKVVTLPDVLKPTAEEVTLEKIAIRDGEVSGELVNRSPQGVYGVELQVLYSWRWNNDHRPGRDDPGRAEYFKIEREISPGQRVPFVHQPSPPLPLRKDGTFDITIKVISFTKIFRSG